MRCFSITVLLQLIFFSYSLCELIVEKQDSFLNAFVDFLNSRPDQPYVYDDGLFLKSSQSDSNTYKIDIRVKVFKPQYPSSFQFQKCTATVLDLGENGVTIPNNEYQCLEWTGDETTPVPEGATTTDAVQASEEILVKEPIHLDNEVQPNNAPTSGEQFIAIPRDRSGPCIGCSSHVDPSAAGVDELAALGARHLDKHEPNVKHTVIAVHDVERQVQVTNGIRYVLTLTIGSNNCSELLKDNCVSDKICKISVISRPWVKYPDGSKYKAILANNCTEQWLFGDDGEPVPETLDENRLANSGSAGEIIKVVHTANVEAQQHSQVPISNEQIKNIQEQIIPYSEFDKSRYSKTEKVSSDSLLHKKQIEDTESVKNPDESTVRVQNPEIFANTQYITEENKKAIDDMLNLFNFAEFQPLRDDTEDLTRGKRSYSSDLKVMSVLEKFQKIKRKLKNAKHIYKLGNLLVDYLNEMDIEVKTRVLKDVIFAEEEIEKDQHFFYMRVRVIIPCDKVDCDSKDTQGKICNGVIDSTDSKSPEVVDTFCYGEEKKSTFGKVKNVPSDDPILLKLTNETIKKIEDDINIHNALRIVKIINANTQKVSGTLTKISMVLEFTNCNKTVPFYRRINCLTVQNLGTKICEAEIHERHWLKEKKIVYTCTDRPMDETIEANVSTSNNKDNKDSQVLEIVNEALQILEVQSNRKYKQKIVEIKSVSTQIVAGQLTNIDFIVGYTKCFTNHLDIDLNNCELIEGERLRKCQAQVWERPWLQEGRQIKVVCDDTDKKETNEIENRRRKRQIAGGKRVDANDPKYLRLAQESLSKYLKDSGDSKSHEVLKVNVVTVKVVSGTLIEIYFDVIGDGEIFSCISRVWERPWLNSRDIKVSCGKYQNLRQKREKTNEIDNRRRKRQIPGGIKRVDANDPKYLRLAQESLSKYLKDTGDTKSHEVLKVNVVTVQVVSGTLTEIDFDVIGEGEIFSCKAKVWERPWLNSRDIKVSCGKYQNLRQKRQKTNETENRRRKRQIVGGIKRVDANDPKYLRLAQESLSKYLQDSGDTKSHEVLKVNVVTVKVVSGTLIEIYFDVIGEGEIFSCISRVWERPWLNSRDIKVSCGKYQNLRQKRQKTNKTENRRRKRQIPGGIKTVDANDPKYLRLAQESLSKYLEDSGDTKSHEVLKVNVVTVKVVSGTLIEIYFDVIGEGEIFSCISRVWERPWLNSRDIKVSCGKYQNLRQKREETNEIDNGRRKRQIPGGIKRVDANDPKYLQLAQESLSKYLQDSGNTEPHTVVTVDEVYVQVVSGTLTKIDFHVRGPGEVFSCHSEVWERPWLKSKEITVNCGNNQISRQKRQMPGTDRDVDPNDPKFMVFAQESLANYSQASGLNLLSSKIQVIRVTEGIVAGTLYNMYFTVFPQDTTDIYNCHSKVWERLWLNKREVTNVTCWQNNSSNRWKRENFIGGLKEKDPKDEKYLRLAQESLSKYLQDSGNTEPHTVVKVKKVYVQVVSGTLTKIDFDVEGSGEVFSCHSEVWERPWLKSKEITINCGNDQNSRQKRLKRDIFVGGSVEEDHKDEKFIRLAEESLNKYVENIGSTKVHKLIELNRVTKQLVSGTITRLDFIMSPTNCDVRDKSHKVCSALDNANIRCHADVWERPWLKIDNKIIDVTCDDLKKSDENPDNLKAGDYASTATKRPTRPRYKSKHYKKGSRKSGARVEQDSTKPLYRTLADEALRKYQLRKKSLDHHEITNVNRVVTQVVSGMKYMIEFEVLRISCALNKINKTECSQKNNSTLICHTVIWSRPWLKSKEINVDCSSDDESNEDFEEDSSSEEIKRKKRDIGFGHTDSKDPNDITYVNLAKEAIKKYQKKVDAEYQFKLKKMLRVTEHVASGFITNIDFSISPTTCLLNNPPDKIDDCQLQQPQVVLYCSAEIIEPSVPRTMVIKVGCKKRNKNKSDKKKEVTLNREKRESPYDDDYVEEDIKYYYADRAITDFNNRVSTNNLYKIVSIHDVHRSVHMDTLMVRLYLEIAMTYCMRYGEEHDLQNCDEIDGMSHKLCLARVYPSPDDELVVQHATMTCDDDKNFEIISGISIDEFIRVSIAEIEKSPDIHYKLVPLGEPNVIPSLNYKLPIRMNFVVHHTNCSKDIDLNKTPIKCVINLQRSGRNCHSLIYLVPNSRNIQNVVVKCAIGKMTRAKRSVSLDPKNATADDLLVQQMVQESIEKLEMASEHKYKQRLLLINGYSSKIVSGRLTTIDFDVGYTTCLKYEWVENTTSCEFLEHLPRRHCVSHVWERLWVENGRQIIVNCEDDETPLEAHIEFESAENAMQLANEALKHIEAKYPNPRRQKIVRIFSLEQQAIAGLHYRMKVEVGLTDCMALSINKDDCKLVHDMNSQNKFCRVNVWMRPWTDHPPSFRVTCDYQSGAMDEIYHHVQAERLFYDFLTTYKPDYLNDVTEMKKRFTIFKENVRKIHELNIYERATARYAVTRFADLSYEEFTSKYLGLKPGLRDHNQVPMRMANIPDVELPAKYDWRDYGAVTEVKDQGSCGSCWAFSVTGNIEGQWKLQSGKLVSLSEQELVDCDDMDNGCNGGLPDNAYRAIEKLGGLETENDYPYEGTDDKCAYNKSLSRVHISGAVNITSNETDMAKWLTRNGPISIGINANAMQFYVGGISHPWKMLCNPTNLDHGVLIVGYGAKDYPLFHKHLPYWIIKNSWGERWGEQGYYRVYRGDGTCGVNQMASSAVI